jgi:transcriptional regulator with XRE-family HTH domain
MAKWPKIGDRLRERLQAVGYWRDGRPEVGRFCVERGYLTTYLYRWLSGATPDHENIYRLARDLGVSPSWLLFGEDGDVIPGGPQLLPSRGAAGSQGPEPEREAASVPPRRGTLQGGRPSKRMQHNDGRNAPYQNLARHRWGVSDGWRRAA